MKGDTTNLEARIRELEKELRNRESSIELLRERLKNNEGMLQDAIEEKNQFKGRIREHDLNQAKIDQYQNLQEDHHKAVHRLQVTKKQLDEAREEIDILKEIVDDLANRGLWDHIHGKYPESFEEYKER